ncbi:hypothetical protein EXIGLDRAFT_220309 [Exidia glandulosa HHB12029]|uniref:WSC domain-containing protein n=1 Tax=Exidia glandulosa HHB12029 TaxID=1314781 RepID=A0A165MPD6_EXIGL|nr:hypothetical protein EXIGLDRAFT_220309 [Exidia glandulosa HHB12029]
MRFSILTTLAFASATTVFAAPAAAAGSLVGCFTKLTYIGKAWPPAGIYGFENKPKAECVAACAPYAYAAFFSAVSGGGCECFDTGVFDISAASSVPCTDGSSIYVFQG